MNEFPVIHTNFWDAILAIPLTLICTQIIKILLSIPRVFVPTIALLVGMAISVFFSHPNDLWAGIFMGFFYGNAAIGCYATLKTSLLAYRNDLAKGNH